MKLLKKISIGVLFLLVTTCEKTENIYIPGVECSSDWTTSSRYHTNVYTPPDIINPPGLLTASINGKPFSADSGVYANKYDGRVWAGGRNSQFGIGISFYENAPEDAILTFSISGYSGITPQILEQNVTITNYDSENGILSAEFNCKVEVHSFDKVYEGIIEIKNGMFKNVRLQRMFCRTLYTLENIEYELYGDYKLIEITDCTSGNVFYPPCNWPVWIEFDTAGFQYPVDPEYYLYDHPLYVQGRNQNTFSYEFLNDTTILTSGGGGTQAGMAKEDHDFYYKVCNLIANSPLIIKRNRNLLELKTPGNVYLRFFKEKTP